MGLIQHGGSRETELGRLPRMGAGASLSGGSEEDRGESVLADSGQPNAEGGRAQSKPRPHSRISELPSSPTCLSL